MRRELTVFVALALVGLGFMKAAAQQEVQSRPGFGSGVMDVRVVNHPAVTASQNGAWEVGLSRPADVRIINSPNVTIARPAFIQLHTKYRVTWSASDSEVVTITSTGGGGWVQVSTSGADRWINLDQARSIEVSR